MPDLDEHLPAIAAGDSRAFARWVAGAEPRVRDSLASFAAVVDVEVVVQETLLRMWQVAPRVVADDRGDSLLRLAVRSARNLAIDHARRKRAVGLDEATAADTTGEAEPALPDPMLRAAILECRNRLPKKPALALATRLGATGESDADLAARVGMRLNTFLQNFTRARKLLGDCLERRGIRLAEVVR